MCAGALYWSQISKVVYGARDTQRGFITMNTKLHPKTTVVGGVLDAACGQILKQFFNQKRSLN
jgi:tRNA(adenine34) deaminase